MKRLLLIATVAVTSVTFSQKGKASSAGLAFKAYWQEKLSGGDPETQAKELHDAMVFIDEAYAHEDTKNDPKTLMYYGKIHIEIPMCAVATGDEKLSAIDAEKSIKDGFASLIRLREVDVKERYVDDADDYCKFYRGQYSNIGSKMYDEKKWSEASQALIGAGMFGEAMGLSDSLYFLYGGLAAFNIDSLEFA
ncbi:MAG: hypothetical protein ACI857_001035, partial [Arenicella sp.]